MSGFEYDNEALNEAFYEDPAAVIAASTQAAAANAVAQYAQTIHQNTQGVEAMKVAAQVEETLRAQFGDSEWDRLRDEAAERATRANLIDNPMSAEHVSRVLAGEMQAIQTDERQAKAEALQREQDQVRAEIAEANKSLGGFSTL